LVDAAVYAAAQVLDERAEDAAIERGEHEFTVGDDAGFEHGFPNESEEMKKEIVDAVLGVRERFLDRLVSRDGGRELLADDVLNRELPLHFGGQRPASRCELRDPGPVRQ